MAWACV
jgi:hypothetical protein